MSRDIPKKLKKLKAGHTLYVILTNIMTGEKEVRSFLLKGKPVYGRTQFHFTKLPSVDFGETIGITEPFVGYTRRQLQRKLENS